MFVDKEERKKTFTTKHWDIFTTKHGDIHQQRGILRPKCSGPWVCLEMVVPFPGAISTASTHHKLVVSTIFRRTANIHNFHQIYSWLNIQQRVRIEYSFILHFMIA